MPAIAGFGVPFVLVTYLALQAGGFDLVLRSQVGIFVWWVILLGVGAGLLPVIRLTRIGWTGVAILGGLLIWTAVATISWTESTERSLIELSRVATLSGILALLVLVQAREGLRRSVCALGAAVAFIAAIALLSRYQPGWFPESGIPNTFPNSRLSYPLEYWNGLAALLAIGLAPLLWTATFGRSMYGRALAAGSIPMVVLACYLTASRGGAIEAGIALIALLVLFPKRLKLCLNLIVPVAGSIALLLLIEQRPELRDRQPGDLVSSQGTEMLFLTVAVFALGVLAQALLARAEQRGKIVVPSASTAVAKRTGVLTAIITALIVVGAFGSGFVGNRWSDFKQPNFDDGTVSRLGNLSSGERYLVWESALDAASDKSLTGRGPGTFEFWWARKGKGTQFVRDAHSLYLEALAELGPIGLLLMLALVLIPIYIAVGGAIRRGSDERRSLLAASAAGMIAFAVAAGIDWAWELTVLPVAFLVLFAATSGPAAQSRKGHRTSRFDTAPVTFGGRAATVLTSLVVIAIIALPMIGTTLVRDSQSKYKEGDIEGALADAQRASHVQPYSASADMQVALVQAKLGEKDEALMSAIEATKNESTNWRTWYVLAQVSDEFGLSRQAEIAHARALKLNTRSSLLDPESPGASE